MISLSSLVYEVTIYSSSHFLELLNKNKIKVIEVISLSNYDYQIVIPYKNKDKFESLFSNIKLIKIKGLKAIFNTIFLYKFSIISLIISLCFFAYLSSLIFIIDIKGNNKIINEQISLFLEGKNIKKYQHLPSKNDLSTYKNEFFFNNIDKLKSVEFYQSGNKIIITYETKEKEVILDDLKGKMYSRYDAIIDKISISSGNVLVKENQYVKVGELLVDDHLYYKDEAIFVGTSGYIYAYTFMLIEIKNKYINDEMDTFTYLLNEARNKVYNTFTSSLDRIDKENILDFICLKKDNYSYIKILYTNYQNIVGF